MWGRGRFNLNGLAWFPMRFKAYYVAGEVFRRDMELTWFGMPVFRDSDTYIGGKGGLEISSLAAGTRPAEVTREVVIIDLTVMLPLLFFGGLLLVKTATTGFTLAFTTALVAW